MMGLRVLRDGSHLKGAWRPRRGVNSFRRWGASSPGGVPTSTREELVGHAHLRWMLIWLSWSRPGARAGLLATVEDSEIGKRRTLESQQGAPGDSEETLDPEQQGTMHGDDHDSDCGW